MVELRKVDAKNIWKICFLLLTDIGLIWYTVLREKCQALTSGLRNIQPLHTK